MALGRMLTLIFLTVMWSSVCSGGAMLNCAHSGGGSCDAGGLFGYCSANLKTGEFGCDEDKYCVKKKAALLKIGKGGGCFGNGKCCCNIQSYCNALFVSQGASGDVQQMQGTQECYNEDFLPVGQLARKKCRDKNCYSIEYEMDGQTGRMFGCETKLYSAQANRPDSPDIKDWKGVSLLSCEKIFNETAAALAAAAGEGTGARRKREEGEETETQNIACKPFKFKNELGKELKGWECCCRGGDKCNQNLRPDRGDMGALFGMGGAAGVTASIAALAATLVLTI